MIVEPEFDAKLKSLLASLGYSGIETSVDEEYEDEYANRILIEVEASSVPKTKEIAMDNSKKIRDFVDNYSRRHTIRHRLKLVLNHPVHAEVGQFVVPFHAHDFSRDDFRVGIVTAIYGSGEEKKYGTRYIEFRQDYHFPSMHTSVYLTEDDYGGHSAGFVQVLTKEEALSMSKKRILDDIESVEYFFAAERSKLDARIAEAIEHSVQAEPYTILTVDKKR